LGLAEAMLVKMNWMSGTRANIIIKPLLSALLAPLPNIVHRWGLCESALMLQHPGTR
jgi:hypothetical protein